MLFDDIFAKLYAVTNFTILIFYMFRIVMTSDDRFSKLRKRIIDKIDRGNRYVGNPLTIKYIFIEFLTFLDGSLCLADHLSTVELQNI